MMIILSMCPSGISAKEISGWESVRDTVTRGWQLSSRVEIAVGMSAGEPPGWLNTVCDSRWQEAFWGRALEILTFSFWQRPHCARVEVCVCSFDWIEGVWYTPRPESEALAGPGWTFPEPIWFNPEFWQNCFVIPTTELPENSANACQIALWS